MFKALFISLCGGIISLYVLAIISFPFAFMLSGIDNNNSDKYAFSQDYSNWQTVTVQNVGSFQVPGDWVVTQYDNVIWLTDKPINEEGFIIYFAGFVYHPKEGVYPQNIFTSTFNNLSPNQLGSFAAQPFGFFSFSLAREQAFKDGYPSSGYSYDNGGWWSLSTYYIDDNALKLYAIGVSGTSSVYMVAWDGTVNGEIVRKITASFTRG